MDELDIDQEYLKQKVKIEIEIEPYKLFLLVTLLGEHLNDGSAIKDSLSESGRAMAVECTQLLTDKCGEAQAILRKKRDN
jgi:hypothetical protein